MKSPAAKLIGEMLRMIRADFFARHSDKRFFQERSLLIQAITWPAKWMNDHGVQAPASVYRKILQDQIDTIRRKGNRAKIRRFSVYFLHCVQEHMKHHGDQYYYTAKAARSIGDVLPSALRATTSQVARAQDRTTDTLSELNRVLRSPGGRRRRRDSGGSEADLFSHCKGSAARRHNARNHSQTFAVPADSGPELLRPPVPSAGDSSDS